MNEVKDFKIGDLVQYFKSRRGVSTVGIYPAIVTALTDKRVKIRLNDDTQNKIIIAPPDTLQKVAVDRNVL